MRLARSFRSAAADRLTGPARLARRAPLVLLPGCCVLWPRSSDALAVRLEQGQVRPGQRLCGLGAEFLDEHLSGPVVRGQSLAAPAVLVQGEHELAPGSLIQRVLLERASQLPDHLGAAAAA